MLCGVQPCKQHDSITEDATAAKPTSVLTFLPKRASLMRSPIGQAAACIIYTNEANVKRSQNLVYMEAATASGIGDTIVQQ
jgi:hypothetical protein